MKLCGCKESCFVRGECWGHYEGILCKNLGERICLIDNSEVLVYITDKEYKNIKMKQKIYKLEVYD
jgi:hypothetical protein